MISQRTKVIRRANSEELLLMAIFGDLETRRAIHRELERRNEVVDHSDQTTKSETVAA